MAVALALRREEVNQVFGENERRVLLEVGVGQLCQFERRVACAKALPATTVAVRDCRVEQQFGALDGRRVVLGLLPEGADKPGGLLVLAQ